MERPLQRSASMIDSDLLEQDPVDAPAGPSISGAGIATAVGLLGLTAMGAASMPPPRQGRTAESMLLRRATYGATEADLAAVRAAGFDGWLNRQLTMTAVDDRDVELQVKRQFPRVVMPFRTLRTLDNDWETSQQLIGATMYRATYSKRQLFERLVEFWFDHFNIYMYKVGAWQTVDFVNTVIRKHALGKFPDMLWASAHHPAMMNYLDNASSTGGNPNQNYARELMELHTLSSTGGYTQTDVEEVSRCLTGWGVEWDSGQPNYAEFEYHDWAHDDGNKVVLGNQIPAGGGKRDGELVLQILASHPNTARFIAKKLVAWFLGQGNFATLENLVADTYMRTGGDIKEMVKVILRRNTVLVASPKFKRPYHLFVSALRVLGAKVTEYGGIRWAYLGQSGHEPYTWSPPNGFPDYTDFWTGLMLPRWNFMLNTMAGGLDEVQFDWRALVQQARTPETLVSRYNQVFFGGEMPELERRRLSEFLSAGALNDNRIRGSIALALCTPAFQWY